GSEYDICKGGDHHRSFRCFPTDFLYSLHGFRTEAVASLSSNYIWLVNGVGFLIVKGCWGDDRRQVLAIFRSTHVYRYAGWQSKAPGKKCGRKEFLKEKEKKEFKRLIAVENPLPQTSAKKL
ncbi:hypothetical protein TNCV_4522821, partial [Trichonephila clavipes]